MRMEVLALEHSANDSAMGSWVNVLVSLSLHVKNTHLTGSNATLLHHHLFF